MGSLPVSQESPIGGRGELVCDCLRRQNDAKVFPHLCVSLSFPSIILFVIPASVQIPAVSLLQNKIFNKYFF